MDKLLVGKIIDTFSLNGTLKVFSNTSNQEIRYQEGNKLLLTNGEDEKEVTVSEFRSSGKFDFVKFIEIDDVDSAREFIGYEICVNKDYKDLKEGYFFYSDLQGCDVVSDGKILGKIIRVEEFPAQITLRAKANNGKEFFIPFIEQFIVKVDIENKQIFINYMEGML
jgi:16S rRNA processing protein RimM